jgi:AraC-like DNA-binding protein
MSAPSHTRGPLGIRLALEVGQERGVSPGRCLAGTGLVAADLDTDDARFAAGQELHVTRNLAGALHDPPGLGVEIGRRVTPARLGIWGFAALTSPTLADLLVLGTRFSPLTPLLLAVSVESHGEFVRLTLDDSLLPEDLRDVLLERDLAAILVVLSSLVGHLPGARVETRLQGERLAALRALGPGVEISGGRPENAFYATATPDEPLAQASSETWRALIRECEASLLRRANPGKTAGLIRSRLLERPATMPSLEQVASELHLDERTIRRHLAAEGTSFRALRDEVREALAVELLAQVGLSVNEVAHRLGYTDATSFSHAFRRWRGVPPSGIRP